MSVASVQGVLPGLSIAWDGVVARYSLQVGDTLLDLNEHIGSGISLVWSGEIQCVACDARSKRSYGGGYCYDCFTTLARCDLCVVSPDRCHYAQGTCREPAWGESFCMQAHTVYLANSSGPKVGITRKGREEGRWLDQGASQGLAIFAAATRRDAGLLEVALARRVSDKTDWRRLLGGQDQRIDLARLRDQLVAQTHLDGIDGEWVSADEHRFRYPGEPAANLTRLEVAEPIIGRLIGLRGQYAILDRGVLNLGRLRGYHVELTWPAEIPALPDDDQLSLF